jgi:predicted O-methyltransferase YrrM
MTNDIIGEKHYVTVWMHGLWSSGEAAPRASDELDRVGWFRRNDLPAPLFVCLENLLAGRCYPKPPPGLYDGDHAARMLLWPTLHDYQNIIPPPALAGIMADALRTNFTLSCDLLTGSLLRTLAASKPGGRILEVGTGTGCGAAWLLDGMDPSARLVTVDLSPERLDVARKHLGRDPRVELVHSDAADFIRSAPPRSFDLIFADSFVSKHSLLDETLALLRPGGFYVIDDMLPVHGWGPDLPRLHPQLVRTLEARDDLKVTKMCWSTGVVVCVKTR